MALKIQFPSPVIFTHALEACVVPIVFDEIPCLSPYVCTGGPNCSDSVDYIASHDILVNNPMFQSYICVGLDIIYM